MAIKKETISIEGWNVVFYDDDPSLFNPVAFTHYESPKDLLTEVDLFRGEVYVRDGQRGVPGSQPSQLFYKGYPIHNPHGPALIGKDALRYIVNGLLHKEDGAALKLTSPVNKQTQYCYYLKGIELKPHQYLAALLALDPNRDLSPFLFDKDEQLRNAAKEILEAKE